MALTKRWILIVRFLGAVDLCTLCGESELAEHIESRNRTIVNFCFEFNNCGMHEIYSSAEVIDFRDPISSCIGMEKSPSFWLAITSLEIKLLLMLCLESA